jgi:16S rRNA (adenine1518-N6/adenine1519-N6)-dimethyltransferase
MRARHKTSDRRRALGQHFLSNQAAARRIVDMFGPLPGQHVIEIGPGRGVLTGLLLEAGVRVTAVEVDPALVVSLRERFAGVERLTVISADILRCDIAILAAGGETRVLANLPYSITGEALVRLFRAAGALTDMTLMLQREVVTRMVAPPGGRVYGSLSVLAQYFTQPRAVMNLAPGSFSPPPAVASTVVAMPFRNPRELSDEAERDYPAFIRMMFAHRRRTLLNNLKSGGYTDPEEALRRAAIDPVRRPETLGRSESLALYAACGSIVSQNTPGGS